MGRLVHLAAPLVILAALGCGGDGLSRVPVKGKVTAKGVPIANATVSFVPVEGTQGEGGIGTTDAEGSFSLTGSRRGDSGVVAGKYRVIVSRFIDRDGTILDPANFKEAENPHAVESIPAPYSGIDSPLLLTVPDKGGTVDVEIPAKLVGKK